MIDKQWGEDALVYVIVMALVVIGMVIQHVA
jgi:hypothetical protein